MIERLRAHLRLFPFFIGLSDSVEARIFGRGFEIENLRIIESLADPKKFLQVEFDSGISGSSREQAAGIERTDAQAIGLFQVIKLIGRNHPARARLIRDVDTRFARNTTLEMASEEAGGKIRAAAS